ncbi:MAG TPA: sugar nucleotide-binding protein [Verrucomicrobiae bacterium]|nr:sugar nucleotide-binding protein [Verrucomicrobiae bacterium]
MIVIIGAGFIGSFLGEYFGDRAVFLEGRYNSLETLEQALAPLNPTVVINCAVKGNPKSIEALEEGSADWKEHVQVNVVLPEWLALLGKKLGFRLVHLSTLMFLDWKGEASAGGFQEDSVPEITSRTSKYAKMKWQAEQRLVGSDAIIARIHLPFTWANNPRNLFSRLPGFGVFVEDASSMTCLDDFAEALDGVLERERVTGVIHFVNEGAMSFHDIAAHMQSQGLIPEGQVLPSISLAELNQVPGAVYQPQVIAQSAVLSGLFLEMPPLQESVLGTLHIMSMKL